MKFEQFETLVLIFIFLSITLLFVNVGSYNKQGAKDLCEIYNSGELGNKVNLLSKDYYCMVNDSKYLVHAYNGNHWSMIYEDLVLDKDVSEVEA